jgi:hypothetical protein
MISAIGGLCKAVIGEVKIQAQYAMLLFLICKQAICHSFCGTQIFIMIYSL